MKMDLFKKYLLIMFATLGILFAQIGSKELELNENLWNTPYQHS